MCKHRKNTRHCAWPGLYILLLIVAFTVHVQAQSKSDIINYMDDLVSQNKIIVGQQCRDGEAIYYSGYQDFVVNLYNQTGKYVGIVGADYGWSHGVNLSLINEKLIDHAGLGGWVTISWHAMNPWNGGDVRDRNIGDFADLYTSGNSAYSAWRIDLDEIAAGLQELKNNDIMVF